MEDKIENAGKIIFINPKTMNKKFTTKTEHVSAIQYYGTNKCVSNILSEFSDLKCNVQTFHIPSIEHYVEEQFPIRQGMSGICVMKIQALLNIKGCKLVVDGRFGSKTKKALQDSTRFIALSEQEFDRLIFNSDERIKNISDTVMFIMTGDNKEVSTRVQILDWIVKTEKYGYQVMTDVDFNNRYEKNNSEQSLFV